MLKLKFKKKMLIHVTTIIQTKSFNLKKKKLLTECDILFFLVI